VAKRRHATLLALAVAGAATAAASLGACATYPPPQERPPFSTVGDWTGPAWRRIAPTVGTRLDPRSPNACARGAPLCMDAIVGEMTGRLNPLAERCDHLAPFALMYLNVSREIRAGVRATRYRSPAYVAHLDAVFATLYFHAIDSWRAGRRNEVPRAWRIAFSAAARRSVSALGDMLLGMNAHISRDLPYALAAVRLRLPDGADATPDVVAIDGDINRVQSRVLDQERRRFDPTVTRRSNLDRWIEPDRMPALIAAWRREAIDNARRLIDAGSPAARERVETAIDANATLRSLLIWRATRYSEPARGTRARDGYCVRQRRTRSR
jgi:uncharacterized protein DUF5995